MARSRATSLSLLSLLLFASLLCAYASYYFARERMQGYNYRLADYVTIYAPLEAPAITSFGQRRGGVLEVGFADGSAYISMELVDLGRRVATRVAHRLR